MSDRASLGVDDEPSGAESTTTGRDPPLETGPKEKAS
jgi:hypothetical protein